MPALLFIDSTTLIEHGSNQFFWQQQGARVKLVLGKPGKRLAINLPLYWHPFPGGKDAFWVFSAYL